MGAKTYDFRRCRPKTSIHLVENLGNVGQNGSARSQWVRGELREKGFYWGR